MKKKQTELKNLDSLDSRYENFDELATKCDNEFVEKIVHERDSKEVNIKAKDRNLL